MKRNISGRIIFFLILLLLGASSVSLGAAMTDYCQVPPFIGTGGEPNILIVADVSGSMSWPAYSKIDNGTAIPYDSTKGYEGYFDPTKSYELDVNSVYQEKTPTGLACIQSCTAHSCVNRRSSCANGNNYGGGTGAFGCNTSSSKPFGCCTATTTSGDCGLQSGNYLNWLNMNRIDLTRWAMTGGRPATCSGSFSNDRCDPELWNQTGNSASGKIGTVCNNSLVNGDGVTFGGCILQSDNGTQVAVPWDRVYGGLAYQFANLLVKPRLGVMTYDSTGVNSNKVFLGDFLASNVNSAAFPYENAITNINSQNPGGGTPTGPAMWDAFNYYAQSTAQYGGFPAQTGSGDRWKNPLYVCDGGGGNNCIQNTCARNYVLLMSDGEWNTPFTRIGSSTTCSTTSTANESSDPMVPAYCMHKGFTNLGTNTATTVSGVYTIGLFMQPGCGLKAMENIALYGSFENSVNTWPGSLTGFPPNTSTCSCPDGTSSGSLCAAMPASSADWDANQDNTPDAFFSASDALQIKQAIMDAVQSILAHATSGTAASVLASGEGSGANLVQATYYPRRKFFDASISWTGGLQNLWYYVDPMFNNSSIREDDGDNILNLLTDSALAGPGPKDYVTELYFDNSEQKAKARLYSSSAGGGKGALLSTIDFEDIASLWEAGTLLWNRVASDRTIYTPLDTSQALSANANKFSADSPNNTATLRPLLNTDDSTASTAVNDQLASNIINYTRGVDHTFCSVNTSKQCFTSADCTMSDGPCTNVDYVYSTGTATVNESYRSRMVKIDLNGNGNVTDTSVLLKAPNVTMDETSAKVWKLGDIIDSTPKIASWIHLNFYDTKWADSTYSDFFTSPTYTNRGMVYVGANDGMLHAFKLGLLQYKWSGQGANEIARLAGGDHGKEMWAFIPKNVLPYLKYLKDTEYCHLHSVDLTPFLVDASIGVPAGCSGDYWTCPRTGTVANNTWRTVLIGGMRFGGACRDTASTCTDCVKTPVTGNGYSSYFALDVTDENNPRFLWEFSNPGLGFSTSGPAIVRISNRIAGTPNSSLDLSANGRWFVVLGSGPTGPIDTASQKFQGRSDQNLKLFVLDLKDGSLVRTLDTGVPFAFSGSLLGSVFDNFPTSGGDYQDKAIYIPYVKRAGSNPSYTWTDGGVLRLLTNPDLNGSNVSAGGGTALNPANWVLSTVMDGIGPVTSAVTHLLNSGSDTCAGGIGKLRLYFGTGRYYYRSTAGTDDPNAQRNLFGIVEPCFDNNAYRTVCLDSDTSNDPTLQTNQLSPVNLSSITNVCPSLAGGWYINLTGPGSYTYDENGNGTITDDVARNYNAERVITDPSAAPSQQGIYFTTYQPYNDLCAVGGKTFIWRLQYDTGGPLYSLNGTALIQVSTGVIQQVNLSTAFTDDGNRRSGAMEGVPPTAQGLSLMVPPNPVGKVLHKRER